MCRDFESAKMFQTGQFSSIPSIILLERQRMPEPFHSLDYVLCAVAFLLVGIATVPLMTEWVR
jgi:hypothetical protein